MARVPSTLDGKHYLRSSAYTLGTRLYIAGCGDHRENGRGKGQRFELEHAQQGYSAWTEWSFNDWVELGGGGMWYKGAEFGDHVSFQLLAPATDIVPNGSNQGNCNVHPELGILIPAANDGVYDVDLETADKFVPLLSADGLWTWSYPDTGLGSCAPADADGGNCHLVPTEVAVHTYVSEVGIIGDNQLNVTFPGIDPTRIPPQWKMRCRVYNTDGQHTIQLVWELEVGRMNGVVVYS